MQDRSMTGLVFTGGEGPEPARCRDILAEARDAAGGALVCAADSGLALAEAAGIRPDCVIGDMDSLPDADRRLAVYPADTVARFPHDKDPTDTELAIRILREKGCDDIRIAGGGGGRTDHLLALCRLFEGAEPPSRWYTAREEIRPLLPGETIEAAAPDAGLPVSVFPVGRGPHSAQSRGLRWPLDGLDFDGGAYSLSNRAETGTFRVTSQSGRFLIIQSWRFV
jgi:thiamine pyrophosphokinase